jgi:chromosome segregation ATPase
MSDTGNGKPLPELPDNRKAAVEAGLAQYNMIAHERDELQNEVAELRTQIAGYKVALEANDARLSDLESRMNSAIAERDRAVSKRAEAESVLVDISAILRAHRLPYDALVKDQSREADEALTSQRRAAETQAAAQNPYFGTPPYQQRPLTELERAAALNNQP